MERQICSSTHLFLEREVMAIVTVGIDLAKKVFAVHGVDETGKPALVRPEVPPAKLLELIAHLGNRVRNHPASRRTALAWRAKDLAYLGSLTHAMGCEPAT